MCLPRQSRHAADDGLAHRVRHGGEGGGVPDRRRSRGQVDERDAEPCGDAQGVAGAARLAAHRETARRVGDHFPFKNEFILRPKSMTNEQIIRLTFLEEAGLLQHVAPVGGLAHPLLPGADEYALAIEGDLCLRVRTDGKTSLDVIPITRIGQEIATILPPVDASPSWNAWPRRCGTE